MRPQAEARRLHPGVEQKRRGREARRSLGRRRGPRLSCSHVSVPRDPVAAGERLPVRLLTPRPFRDLVLSPSCPTCFGGSCSRPLSRARLWHRVASCGGGSSDPGPSSLYAPPVGQRAATIVRARGGNAITRTLLRPRFRWSAGFSEAHLAEAPLLSRWVGVFAAQPRIVVLSGRGVLVPECRESERGRRVGGESGGALLSSAGHVARHVCAARHTDDRQPCDERLRSLRSVA